MASPPDLKIDPKTLSFRGQIGSPCPWQHIALTNIGGETLHLHSIEFTGVVFGVVPRPALAQSLEILPGETQYLAVMYLPNHLEDFSQSAIYILSDAIDGSQLVYIEGRTMATHQPEATEPPMDVAMPQLIVTATTAPTVPAPMQIIASNKAEPTNKPEKRRPTALPIMTTVNEPSKTQSPNQPFMTRRELAITLASMAVMSLIGWQLGTLFGTNPQPAVSLAPAQVAPAELQPVDRDEIEPTPDPPPPAPKVRKQASKKMLAKSPEPISEESVIMGLTAPSWDQPSAPKRP